VQEATYPPAESAKSTSDSHSGRVTSYLVLQAVGFALPVSSPTPRCALTAPFHRCLCSGKPKPSAVYFLWHFPAGHPGWLLATTVPCPARTFLQSASGGPAVARPTLFIDYFVTNYYSKSSFCCPYVEQRLQRNVTNLIKNKESTGREKDKLDAKYLRGNSDA